MKGEEGMIVKVGIFEGVGEFLGAWAVASPRLRHCSA